MREQKKAVERYGYTQKEVADFIGVHYSVVSRLLR
ncbi:MAG: helix-turn-helix transcriptional regulator [Nitrospirae bacterium]|nr:helix-turn-helix transcriptional regulator [Nitrospirota bacterium]